MIHAEVEWALLVYSLVCALIAAAMAKRKSRHVGLWSLLGLAFGIFALIVLSFREGSLGEGDKF